MDAYVLLAKDNIFFKGPRSLEIKRGWMEVKVYLYTDCINIHTLWLNLSNLKDERQMEVWGR